MKYIGIPLGMWALFEKSFREHLVSVLGYDEAAAKSVSKKAKPKYKEIIHFLPQFEKDDRFQINIINCAMLCAFILSMPKRPKLCELTDYYAKSMMTKPMKWFCRQNGKTKFSKSDKQAMKETAERKYAIRNPYSWNMDYYEYANGSGYEARFTKCGICALMKKLGLYDLTPALCRLDYTMSEAGKTSVFVREYTIASGGPCEVTAVEVSPRKSELARRRMEAAGVADHVRSICADGRALPDELGTFDLVFLDAPCSGTGTLSRHPEIAWSLAPGAPAELAALQAELLVAAAARVAPGGRLVYATCSVLAEENDAVVGAFLADPAAKGFELGRTGLTGPGAASDTHFHACLRRVR